MANSERDTSAFLAYVASLAPFDSIRTAEAAVRATLRALGTELFDDERREILQELPPSLRVELAAGEGGRPGAPKAGAPTARAFYERVASAESAGTARGVEHAQVVCRALAERVLEATTRQRLQKHLPHLAELFEIPEPPSRPDPPVHATPATPHDLAEGRPGGTRPIASSDTRSLAHRHSVARSDDPHADTRLSTSQGTAQEREGRTLASGRPGSRRPLSDSH